MSIIRIKADFGLVMLFISHDLAVVPRSMISLMLSARLPGAVSIHAARERKPLAPATDVGN